MLKLKILLRSDINILDVYYQTIFYLYCIRLKYFKLLPWKQKKLLYSLLFIIELSPDKKVLVVL